MLSEPQWLVSSGGSVTLHAVVKPGSAHRRILRRDPRGLLIALNSPPSKGRANEELIAFLADLLDTPRSAVTIIRGHTARMKIVRIANPQPVRVAALLRAYP
ncbi:MAG: DUF167 domain-containing protein [Deltaproteobacteria bacterium]|nr:DUF167 domain-containing protein [Deltaproteobacteria bacterium]